jgi:hypothetical protein
MFSDYPKLNLNMMKQKALLKRNFMKMFLTFQMGRKNAYCPQAVKLHF